MIKLLYFLFGIYIFALVVLWIFQEKLLFFPRSDNPYTVQKLQENNDFVHLKLRTNDEILLDGWAKFSPKNTKNILFFDGNTSNITETVLYFPLSDANIFAFNYRGYGKSQGNPSEKAIFSDAEAIFDFLQKEYHLSPENTYLMGRSLGSGVATFLASQKSVRGVILVTPYDSIEAIAREKFAIFPVQWILLNRFLSVDFASKKPNPVLMIIAKNDTVVPNHYTKNLVQSWNGEVQEFWLDNATHDNIMAFSEVWEQIDAFLKK